MIIPMGIESLSLSSPRPYTYANMALQRCLVPGPLNFLSIQKADIDIDVTHRFYHAEREWMGWRVSRFVQRGATEQSADALDRNRIARAG